MSRMWQELWTQGDAWASGLEAVLAQREALGGLLERARGRELRFLGAGSSYYLGLAAAPLWAKAGWNTRVLPASEGLLHPQLYPYDRPPLALAVSRSGTTTETVRALAVLKEAGAPTIAITTEPGRELSDWSDITVAVTGGREKATVQTRSFAGQLVAAQALAALAAGNQALLHDLEKLPPLASPWLERCKEAVAPLAGSVERVYFLGTGERWGLAQEGALKMKETALTEAEAFQTLEFRHGPMSMVDEKTLVVGLVSERAQALEWAVLEEMAALGGQVLAIGERLEPASGVLALPFGSGLQEPARAALYLPPLHLLAFYRAQAKGISPDHPRNLSFAVQLKLP